MYLLNYYIYFFLLHSSTCRLLPSPSSLLFYKLWFCFCLFKLHCVCFFCLFSFLLAIFVFYVIMFYSLVFVLFAFFWLILYIVFLLYSSYIDLHSFPARVSSAMPDPSSSSRIFCLPY